MCMQDNINLQKDRKALNRKRDVLAERPKQYDRKRLVDSTAQDVLEAAVWNNDITALTEALEKGFEVNSRNSDGNTLLHIAIKHNAGYESLKLLLDNGASASIMNNNGLKPLHLIQQDDSASTLLKLFKLEKYINAHDYDGNTLMHALMSIGVDVETLKKVKVISSGFETCFRVQNNKGKTPLHIAAGKPWVTEDALDFVLSNIDESTLLKRDFKGNTFFHTYVKITDRFDFFCPRQQYFERFDEFKSDLLNNILDGKYECCIGESLKQLVNSRNDCQETPFYICATTGYLSHDDPDLCEKFLKAGADVNCSNIKGDTVFHNLNYCTDEKLLSATDDILRNGADVNKQNIFQETPLFQAESYSLMVLLLHYGADVNVKNKVGRNVLMAYLLIHHIDPHVIELLLEHGVDVNAEDNHGNTCLHYAALKYVSKDVVQQLKRSGAKIKQNKMGELPCTVAEKMQNYDLIDELCVCEPDRHSRHQILKIDAIKIDDLQKVFVVNEDTSAFDVNDLLKTPSIGSVEFKGEADELKQAVTNVVKGMCQVIGERDDLLKNTVFQTGSVGEKTKVGLPDEFDFICLIDFISNKCELDQERSEDDPGYAYVKLKEEFLGEEWREMFDADCYLENYLIYLRFVSALRIAMNTPYIYTHPHLVLCRDKTREDPKTQIPNCNFSLRWTGAIYKDIVIDVDLVPACRIPHWWPSNANLESIAGDSEKVKSDGAILLLHTILDEEVTGIPQAKLRVSAQAAEKVHMEALPQLARDSYMVSKILCSGEFCAEVSGDSRIDSGKIKSYMLKNCMFHVFKEVQVIDDAETQEQPSQTLKEIVIRIFKMLISFAESNKLPTFMFPWQNVLTFPNNPNGDDILLARLKVHCMFRKIYAKVIIRLLGEDVDFTDCESNPYTYFNQDIETSDTEIDYYTTDTDTDYDSDDFG